jgi:acyl-CoA dehydrogenase
MNEPIYFTDEHRQFRDNLRRFIAQEIVPRADAWEEEGMVPREVLRQMGSLGFLGIRYPEP